VALGLLTLGLGQCGFAPPRVGQPGVDDPERLARIPQARRIFLRQLPGERARHEPRAPTPWVTFTPSNGLPDRVVKALLRDRRVRQALLAKIGPAGNKAKPGPTYGVKSHAWSALAVAVTAEARGVP